MSTDKPVASTDSTATKGDAVTQTTKKATPRGRASKTTSATKSPQRKPVDTSKTVKVKAQNNSISGVEIIFLGSVLSLPGQETTELDLSEEHVETLKSNLAAKPWVVITLVDSEEDDK